MEISFCRCFKCYTENKVIQMLESPSLFHNFLTSLVYKYMRKLRIYFNQMAPYYHKYVFTECC